MNFATYLEADGYRSQFVGWMYRYHDRHFHILGQRRAPFAIQEGQSVKAVPSDLAHASDHASHLHADQKIFLSGRDGGHLGP
jgi:hypothetical protein